MFLDQLRIEKALVPYMGRPQVLVRELCEPLCDATGAESPGDPDSNYFTLDEVQIFFVDADPCGVKPDLWLSPVSLTWPMGFSHSAFVAMQLMS